MRITFLVSSAAHPINETVRNWIHSTHHLVNCNLVRSPEECQGGDLCFLVSCTEVVAKTTLAKYKRALVIHASDLPLGRGWSPHVYALLEGHEQICVSLIEAAEGVDTGDIVKQLRFQVQPYFLLKDILEILSKAHVELFDYAVSNFKNMRSVPQSSEQLPTYYQKRNPEDSMLNINATIAEQFNLMRAADPERFPSFFEIHGKRFNLIIERLDDD